VFRVSRNYTKQITKIIIFLALGSDKNTCFRLKTHIFRWKWWIFAIFGPIWTQLRSKQLKIWPESHFWSDWLNRIDSISIVKSFSINFGNPLNQACQTGGPRAKWIKNGGIIFLSSHTTFFLSRLNNLKFVQEAIFFIESTLFPPPHSGEFYSRKWRN
jgi:hypothetical protein